MSKPAPARSPAKPRSRKASPGGNRPREKRPGIGGLFRQANHRAHEQANRRGGRRAAKSMRAAIDAAAPAAAACDDVGPVVRVARWGLAALLLPLVWLTLWTLLSQFSRATLQQGFWQSAEFWYFATGCLLMGGWFWSGLLDRFFLYLYVLGHELTHALFVILHFGKVTDFHVSTRGGYITTNKTNWIIALSPYFVPFWSVVAMLLYIVLRHGFGVSAGWDRWFCALVGLTWTFHCMWTLWMLPRDQPDLRDNGTVLSMVVILLANLLVLVALLCVASEAPLARFKDFSLEWLRHAILWTDAAAGWLREGWQVLRGLHAR